MAWNILLGNYTYNSDSHITIKKQNTHFKNRRQTNKWYFASFVIWGTIKTLLRNLLFYPSHLHQSFVFPYLFWLRSISYYELPSLTMWYKPCLISQKPNSWPNIWWISSSLYQSCENIYYGFGQHHHWRWLSNNNLRHLEPRLLDVLGNQVYYQRHLAFP
jgi:hypothetical protein